MTTILTYDSIYMLLKEYQAHNRTRSKKRCTFLY